MHDYMKLLIIDFLDNVIKGIRKFTSFLKTVFEIISTVFEIV